MIINKVGDSFLYEGITYRIGDKIVGTTESEYAGLNGVIFEIRDGEDKETENDTPDIYCSFHAPVLPNDIAELERVFSELYQEEKHLEDIILDYVIMAPEMIMVKHQKSINVYALTEDWAIGNESGRETRLSASILEAKAMLNDLLFEAISNGCISDWIQKPDYMTEITETSYEGWVEDNYLTAHYAVYIEEMKLGLTPDIIGKIGRLYLENCRYEDFASQAAQKDNAMGLCEEDYQRLLADKRIPDLIDDNLGDHYYESYWEAVSEAVDTLLSEYLKKRIHAKRKKQR